MTTATTANSDENNKRGDWKRSPFRATRESSSYRIESQPARPESWTDLYQRTVKEMTEEKSLSLIVKRKRKERKKRSNQILYIYINEKLERILSRTDDRSDNVRIKIDPDSLSIIYFAIVSTLRFSVVQTGKKLFQRTKMYDDLTVFSVRC